MCLPLAAMMAPAARAQQPTLPRLMRAALGPLPGARTTTLATRAALPVRWPRAPLGGPMTTLADDVVAQLLRIPPLTHDAGRGATVCVIDTGADLTHAALRDTDGHTRVRALLDLDAAPRGSASAEVTALEAEFGAAVWDRAAIDAALRRDETSALPSDRYGHGTAVAALAMGRGIGVAQGAELVVVRALRDAVPGFRDEDVALGAQFCARASRDVTRTVVLVALGGHDGAHDGTEPLERALAAFAGLVVVAAGNDGDAAVHASVLLDDSESEIFVRVPSPGRAVTAEQHVALAIRVTAFDGARDDVSGSDIPGSDVARSDVALALAAPDGTTTEWTAPDATTIVDAPGAQLTLAGNAASADGTHVVHALINNSGAMLPLVGGTYRLRVRGRGRVDVWLAGAELIGALFPPTLGGAHIETSGSVTIPGTAAELVTVGALASRLTLGALTQDAQLGLPASFTSIGPTPTGAPKPDVAAPGTLVVTALSRDVRDGERNLVGGSAAVLASRRVGADRVALDGSSYSAALIAGVFALALSESPSRGESDRALLVATAARISAGAWDARGGAGLVDVAHFLAARRARIGVDVRGTRVDEAASRASLTRSVSTAGATDVYVFARVVDLRGEPLARGAVTLTRNDANILTLPIVEGIARGRLPSSALVPGTLRFAAHTDDGSALGDVVIRVVRDDAAGGATARGGACSAAPGAVPMSVGGWVVLIVLLAGGGGRPWRQTVTLHRSLSLAAASFAIAIAIAPAAASAQDATTHVAADDGAALDGRAELALGAALHHDAGARTLRWHCRAERDLELCTQAEAKYRLAAAGYAAYLHRYPNHPQAYELRYTLADALYESRDYDGAAREYATVRDSNADRTHLVDSARRVVESLNRVCDQREASRQLEIRTTPPEPVGTPPTVTPAVMPDALRRLFDARERYLARVDAQADREQLRESYDLRDAQLLYAYGDWSHAKVRLTRIFDASCSGPNANERGRVAWIDLRNIAVALGQVEEAERLSQVLRDRACTFGATTEELARRTGVSCPVAGQYRVATATIDEAQQATGAERTRLYERAASLFVRNVNECPSDPQAPIALEQAAIALQRVNRFESAGHIYQRILDEHSARRGENPEEQARLDRIVSNAYSHRAYCASHGFDDDSAIANYRVLAESARFANNTEPSMVERRENALINIANILERRQQYTEAARYWQRVARTSRYSVTRLNAAYRVAEMSFNQRSWANTVREMRAFMSRYRGTTEAGELSVRRRGASSRRVAHRATRARCAQRSRASSTPSRVRVSPPGRLRRSTPRTPSSSSPMRSCARRADRTWTSGPTPHLRRSLPTSKYAGIAASASAPS